MSNYVLHPSPIALQDLNDAAISFVPSSAWLSSLWGPLMTSFSGSTFLSYSFEKESFGKNLQYFPLNNVLLCGCLLVVMWHEFFLGTFGKKEFSERIIGFDFILFHSYCGLNVCQVTDDIMIFAWTRCSVTGPLLFDNLNNIGFL